MGVINAIKESRKKAMQVAGEAEIKMHRKYVWNDFSIGLEKAKLHILEPIFKSSETITNISDMNFERIHTLYVQINPSSFRFKHALQRSATVPAELTSSAHQSSGMPSINYSRSNADNPFTLPLTYDIYDEFMARTGNESYPDLTGFSLYDRRATSLPVLIDDVTHGVRFVQFVWGPVKKFGVLEGIEVDYTAFSRWGDPLKATAEVAIQEWFLNDEEEINVGSGSIDDVTKLSGSEKAAQVGKNIVAGAANIFR